MSIQSNINQMLSVASVALQMNPTLKAKAKERETMKDLSRKEKAAAKASELVPESDVDLASSVAAEQADLAERRFKLDPTKETYEAASQKRSVAQERLEAEQKVKAKAKEREEMKELSRKEKVAAKASKLVPESDVDLASSVAAEQADLAERRFKLKPTEKNYKAASQKRSVAQERLDAARKAAQERLEAEQNERRQNRAITSAGMSLDEFPEHVQAIIKKQLGGETK